MANYHITGFLGEGKLLFGSNYYEGHFRHDKMLGPGKYVFSNGVEQQGEYVVDRVRRSHATLPQQLNNRGNVNDVDDEFVTEWRCKTIVRKC